jgi:hypothetical protein
VRTRDKATILVLRPRQDDRPTAPDGLPTSHTFFYCDDLARTYDELRARGVDFPQPPVRQSWGWWSMFEDQDGNRFALGPREAARSGAFTGTRTPAPLPPGQEAESMTSSADCPAIELRAARVLVGAHKAAMSLIIDGDPLQARRPFSRPDRYTP